MRQYLDLLRDIRDNGEEKGDRTGTGTKSVFGRQVRYDLSEGFPAVTTKKLYFNSVVHELLWFLKGTGNIEYLAQNNVHIWDEWPFVAYLRQTHQEIPEQGSHEWKAKKAAYIEQVIANGAAIIWSFAVTVGILLALRSTIGLRVTEQTEIDGLDIVEHAEEAYH